MSQGSESSFSNQQFGKPTYRYSTPLPKGSPSSQSPLLSRQTEPSTPGQSPKFPRTSEDIGQYEGSNYPTSTFSSPSEQADLEPNLPSIFSNDPEHDRRNTSKEAPWKYAGYRVFSRFMASDDAFLIVRRFGNLNARIALSLQDDIVLLEQQLDDLERGLSRATVSKDIDNSSFRKDAFEERRTLIKKTLPAKLMEYNAFINGYTTLLSRPDIHHKDLSAVKDWLEINERAIDPEEACFLDNKEDLVGIKPKSRSCFRSVLEFTFLLQIPGIRRVFARTPVEYGKVRKDAQDKTIFQDDRRVEGFSSTLVACMGLGMLVGPLWILKSVTGVPHRLAIITSFIGIFFLLVKVATRARILDALGAAAAYSAVLMVFLQAVGV